MVDASPSTATVPEGEGKVDRRKPGKHPEFYVTVIERPPTSWNLPDPLQVALESPLGFEIWPADQDKNAVRVKVRCPYQNYLKSIREGEKKSEERRRIKTEGAVVDESKRVGIDLQRLMEGKEPDQAKDE